MNKDFFEKDYTSDLTSEELFISVAYFQFDIEDNIIYSD